MTPLPRLRERPDLIDVRNTLSRRAPSRALAAALLLAAFACAQPAQQRYEERLEEAPGPAQHAVHSERLAETMRGLERLRRDRLPRAMDLRAERAQRLEVLAQVARGVVDSADQLAEATDGLSLDPEARAEFLGLARTLGRRAEALAADASGLSDAGLADRVAELESTCEACHSLFRPPAR